VIEPRIQPDIAPALATVPRHVAIIMDGNRRWARANNLPPLEGHRRGMRTLHTIVETAAHAGVEVLTVYAFSEENWQRDRSEIGGLMEIGAVFARRETAQLVRDGVRVRLIGRRDRIPGPLRDAFDAMERRSAHNRRITLNLAVDYGARSEIAQAMRALARDVADGRVDPEAIDEEALERKLWTAGLPDPDLLIRTGGDLRLSNFLLFQCAYTELWSTPIAWPAFGPDAFHEALAAFSQRQRRFGR
jgi:undecaprenyl diphosphate synthase